MKVLVLGGTRFFGKQAVKEMLKRGYEVTIATRGQTKDEFGEEVSRIHLDRQNPLSLKEKLKDKSYDVIVDNICYAPDDVKDLMDVVKGRVGKYIVTSSLAVYDKGMNKKEEDFNPYTYPVIYGDRTCFNYGEGKRLVEAVCYQDYKDIPTIAVRFPIVIGKNDYTKRLFFYEEHIIKEKAFSAPGWDEEMSFITEEEAGVFLASLVEKDFVGPLNACSNGTITVHQIIKMIEDESGKKVMIENESENKGPYSTYGDVTLDSTKAISLGMHFQEVEDAFKEIMRYDLNTLKKR